MAENRKNRKSLSVIILLAVLCCTIAVIAGVKLSNGNKPNSENKTSSFQPVKPDNEPVDADTQKSTENETTAKPETTQPITEKETAADKEQTTEEKQTAKEEQTSEERTVTVYATTRVNVRKNPGTEYDIVATLNEGDKVERISKGDNGWSKVIYDGKIRYISSKYLTKEKPQTDPIKRNVVDPRGENWNLTVVNFYNEYDSTYEPKLKKVCADYGYNIYMDERVADWYTKMYKAALKDGIKLVPLSGYRSYATQEKNYKNRIKLWQSKGYSYNEAVKKTAQVILPPGTSEHNLGLAMDICRLDYNFDESKEYKWLDKHAQDYGFILRYTEENKGKTGVVAEPWHWRFVGVEDAKAIKESGLCLEDYVKTKL